MRTLLLLVVLSACKSDSKPAASSEPKAAEPAAKAEGTPAPAGSAGSAAAAEPAMPAISGIDTVKDCILQPDDAAKLLGVEIKHAGGTGETCTYSGASDWSNVNMQMFTVDAAAKYKEFRDTDIAGPEDKDVKGIGTKAYRRGTGLSFGILANNKFVSFSAGVESGKPRPTPEVVEAVMKNVASRM